MESFKTNMREFCDLSTILATVTANKTQFGLVFVVVLLATYTLFYAIDFVPEPPQDSYASETVDTDDSLEDPTIPIAADQIIDVSEQETYARLPVRMYIDALEREIPILNPTSRTISDLDEALRHGAVRHPDAANLRQDGNIFILGHSSYLPNVVNRNYQIFNGIENLQWGDVIRVFSENREYIYRVDRVYEARASALVIPIADTGARLTLATCDSFGSIDDRFIVEAELQSSRPIH